MKVGTVFSGEDIWAASYTPLWAPSCHYHVGQALPPFSCEELRGLLPDGYGSHTRTPHNLQGKGKGVGPCTSAASPSYLLSMFSRVLSHPLA